MIILFTEGIRKIRHLAYAAWFVEILKDRVKKVTLAGLMGREMLQLTGQIF